MAEKRLHLLPHIKMSGVLTNQSLLFGVRRWRKSHDTLQFTLNRCIWLRDHSAAERPWREAVYRT